MLPELHVSQLQKARQRDALVGTGIFQMHSANECASVVFITFNANDVADASHMRKGDSVILLSIDRVACTLIPRHCGNRQRHPNAWDHPGEGDDALEPLGEDEASAPRPSCRRLGEPDKSGHDDIGDERAIQSHRRAEAAARGRRRAGRSDGQAEQDQHRHMISRRWGGRLSCDASRSTSNHQAACLRYR